VGEKFVLKKETSGFTLLPVLNFEELYWIKVHQIYKKNS